MMKRGVLVVAVFALALPPVAWAQGNPNFAGTWKLDKFDPPLPAGRGGRGGPAPGPGGPGYDESIFGAITQTVSITQAANEITVQNGPRKAAYPILANVSIETVERQEKIVPPGDVNGLKTWAHWDGARLHLHFKQGQNWGRDVLSFSGGTLSILRDLEAGGGSTTRTLMYSKSTS